MNGTVLLDTNVFTAPLQKGRPLEARYARYTIGPRLAVTPQTVSEATYGALSAGWGPRRLAELTRAIDAAAILEVDAETTDTVARLRNTCRQIGHALHQRHHNADLWIAAAAIRWGMPLVAHDAVFIGCPRLDLRTEVHG